MKALVTATCLAVLGFVVYFFWGEYMARNQRIAEARLAEASMCETMLADLRHDRDHDWRVLHIAMCVKNGHLSKSNFDTPELDRFYEAARSNIESD